MKYLKLQSKLLLPLVIMLSIVVIGTVALIATRAATDSIPLEVENGTITGASKINAPLASGSSAIKFGAGTSGAMNIYFGTTHMHTGCCNSHGQDESTADDLFRTAKEKNFDWMFVTEHSGSTGPSSQGKNPADFYADVNARAAQYTDASFVGFGGYEFSDNDGSATLGKGHMTGIGTDEFVSANGEANAVTLMDYLVAQTAAGKKVFGGYNHPGSGGHPGSDANLLTPARRNIVVMSEIHNSMEEQGGDADNFTGLIRELDRGWRLAPVCGLDGHGLFRIKNTVEPNPCRTGVLATSLSKDTIADAFLARRVYSSRDTNMEIRYKANGQWMGSIIGKPSTVNFEITVSDPDTGNDNDKIKKIQILTENGAEAAVKSFDDHNVTWNISLPANNKKYYMIRVFNGERTTYTAAAAPVWLE